ncbi:MAG: hypothetical protein R2824_24050 [Saprospiraceae bacterium]|nr:hypothetical protein [Lewinella sp.]
MTVFAERFLEEITSDSVIPPKKWNWEPPNPDIMKIYASGAKTATKASTYASEKDNERDTDRPNEGA